MMEVVSTSKYVRQSPQKVREVIDAIRGKLPQEALVVLEYMPKKAAYHVAKTIKTAMANATNNFKLKEENLKIKSIEVSSGPTIRRFRAASRGRANEIRKRTSHIKVVLEETNGTKS